MSARRLDRSDWCDFFAHLSKVMIGKRSEIEVLGLAIGAQIEAAWSPLLGISYDRKDDVIEIALDEVDHVIHRPREVFFDLHARPLVVLLMIECDGLTQIVKLRDPQMLPPPAR